MERVRLSLDEIAKAGEAERCLACDAPASSGADPVLAPGVDLGALDEHLPAWTVCVECVRDQVANERRARRTQIALATLPSLGLAIAVLVPFAHPSAPMLGAAIGALITFAAMRVAARQLGRGIPLVLVAARKSHVEIVRRGPRAPHTDPVGPYRSAAPPAGGGEASAVIGGGGWAWLFGTALAGLAAFFSTSALYPRVRLDNARYARAHVEIDGERAVHVSSGDSLEISLRHGAHRLTVQYPDEPTAEVVDVVLPLGSPHLFAVDGERCFHVSSTSQTRPHRWANVEQVSTRTSTVRGRWLELTPGGAVTRASCDDAPWWAPR